MNIGFDLDGIFIDKPPIIPKKIIEWLYRGHDHRLFYRFPSKPEQWIRNITHVGLLRPAIGENIQEIRKIRLHNAHRYYLISSRFGFLKKRTEYLIKKYELQNIFYDMFFNSEDEQPHVFKEDMLRKLKIDRYVDDDLPLLQFLAPRNQKIQFYWFNTKITKLLGKNLFAITNLSTIIEK